MWIIYIYIYITYILYICIYIYIVKRRYNQNLLETFYIVTNSFTLSLDSHPQTIRSTLFPKRLYKIYFQ